jgi:glycosyltransferase involved in cell wall biosynthesis
LNIVDSESLTVLIGADSLRLRRSGVGRMTFEIARTARTAAEISRVKLLMGGAVLEADALDTLGEFVGTGKAAGFDWKTPLARLPGIQVLRRIRHAGVHRTVKTLAQDSGGRFVYYEPNMIARRFDVPTVVTINDLSWHHEPSWHPTDRLAWIARHLDDTLRRARRITALSQFTKDAAVRALGILADRIDVVTLAPAREFQPVSAEDAAPVLTRFGLEDRSFVLSTSTIEPRKNFDRLFTAHQRLPEAVRRRFPLVIAGGQGWGTVLNHAKTDAAARRGELYLLGHVADADLVALCARAAVFAYVSLYEGFGLPVVEAMATGCAVLASGTTSIPEVAGKAALLVDPLDETAIAEGLRRLIEDAGLAEQLRQAGLVQAGMFSWEGTVSGLAACWREALR